MRRILHRRLINLKLKEVIRGNMELIDTVEMMNSENYKERFRAEYFQLKIRAEGLEKMLEKYKAGTLPFEPSCDYEILYTQYIFMKHYQYTLEDRARIENIIL